MNNYLYSRIEEMDSKWSSGAVQAGFSRDESFLAVSAPRSAPEGGGMYDYEFVSARCRPGTVRSGTVYLPSAFDRAKPAALQVTFDGLRAVEPAVVETLVAEGAMPPAVLVGSRPGVFRATREGGSDRSTRSPEYDGLGPSLPDLIVDEFLPALERALGISFSPDPNLHAATGCSSGGIASWNACWERNDFFRRCYINSPTFSSFRGGDCYPFLIRKYETKPIRCYITAGTDDMRNSAGDWHLEAESAKEALAFAGYEFEYECFENGPHGAGNGDPEVLARALRFAWKDWATRPVGILHLPPRVADIVSPDTAWESTDEPLPGYADAGGYSFEGNRIFLNGPGGVRRCVAELPDEISAIARSSDGWRLYVGMPSRRFVYAFAMGPDGSLLDGYPHGHLHVADDVVRPGAFGLAVDTGDRVYAATELGVQTISQQGENNTVLSLPRSRPVVSVAFGGSRLFVRTATGETYARPVLTSPATGLTPPDTPPF